MKPSIAIVDDDPDLREDVKEAIELSGISDRWQIITAAPFRDPLEYCLWINAHKVSALIADWRLNERGKGDSVDYTAERIIEVIRAHYPSFPIFICSNFPEDARVYSTDIEYISGRNDFVKQIDLLRFGSYPAGFND